ncbi:DNA-directed RNA polymerase subunit beta [Microbacterium sorbitolivorans]|uniref:DNA-directed RNA polymerase subunit beta n=1 Tax=Microbacterium sorbitolivorans TaxID=1867410 RepID=A0A367XU24_9MICO|nr:DNA-directed RNA polymerase subunit beta [Microbacterium sorbitolivorans]RCK57125.1 DNA-directed RNA polymerase subunit beta [Microbacterium sorbitolivorans]
MPKDFSRPVFRPSETFDRLFESEDPAEVSRAAHATATTLLARVRSEADPDAVERLISFAAVNGIDDIAHLWSRSPAKSLPGALWRMYLIQLSIHDDPQTAALLYERGRVELSSTDPIVAGAPVPAGPAELVALIDTILRGAFTGDFAVALDRAAAFCRVQASGSTHLADDYEGTEPERATTLTNRASRLAAFADELAMASRLWRRGDLI